MEEEQGTRNIEQEDEQGTEEKQIKEEKVLQFLDSVDGYLTLLDSLSSTLSQGWLDLASARHSMGVSRISSAMFDVKIHSAATTVQLSKNDVDSEEAQLQFILRKWGSADGEDDSFVEAKSVDLQLRQRNRSQHSDYKASEKDKPLTLDDQVKKRRSKSLSAFGALVSPKLRASQLSFETALEMLVEIANIRAAMLCTYDQVRGELEGCKK